MSDLQLNTESKSLPISIIEFGFPSLGQLTEDKDSAFDILPLLTEYYTKTKIEEFWQESSSEIHKGTGTELGFEFRYFYAIFQLPCNMYIYRNFLEITEFLKDNLFLTPLLLQANEKIREYFPLSELVLEVVVDREDTNGEEELVIFICTNLSPEEALDKLEALYRDWWLDVSFDFKEKISINLELV